MSAQKAFGNSIFRLIAELFPLSNSDGYRREDDIYVFTFDDKDYTSDSVSDLAETAIREVERTFQRLIAHGGGVYYTHHFEGPLSNEFYGCFKVLERPYRIEFYADTFRKGVVLMRKIYKVL